MSIREVPPKTPFIDQIERIPKVGRVVGVVLRALRRPWLRRHERKVQDDIDKRFHDRLRNGQGES